MDKLYIKAGALAEYLHCPILGDRNKKIFHIALYQESDDASVTYVPYNLIDKIPEIQAGTIITTSSFGLPLHRNYIISRHDPHEMLSDVICFLIKNGLYGVKSQEKPAISKNSTISDNVSIGNGTVIGNHVVLSPGVVIGENVTIENGCSIGANTIIGDYCSIGSETYIGACCNIGTENFEYHKLESGWRKIPAVGNVQIGSNVKIGGNVVVERGTIGTTQIGDFTQIENLVQIGHEAKIGARCHIVACVAIAGWAEIGDCVDIYGQSAIGNHVKIGDGSILFARTGADKNIQSNSVVSGFPAQNHQQELRYQAFLRKLFKKR